MFIQGSNFGHQASFKCGHVRGRHNSGDHIHQFLELELITEGEIEITVNGRVHIARAGDIAVIPPFKVHSFNTPERVKMLIATMPGLFIPPQISRDELYCERESFVFHASEALWGYLEGTDFDSTQTKWPIDLIKDRELILKLQATVHLILAEFLTVTRATDKSRTSDTLARILLYISEHFAEDITISSISEALGYSPKYVSNCFAALPGISFRDFLNQLRIEEAKHKLSSGEDTVLSIAIECGFKNESSFHRIFREITGTTPAKYRAEKKLHPSK